MTVLVEERQDKSWHSDTMLSDASTLECSKRKSREGKMEDEQRVGIGVGWRLVNTGARTSGRMRGQGGFGGRAIPLREC
jgi:hypothetical protein